MELIDGKAISALIKEEIKNEVAAMIDNGENTPHLVAVIIGEDPASMSYVRGKENACRQCGITSSVYKLPAATTQKELLDLIDFLNRDEEVDGMIVQLPVPEHINPDVVIDRIDPKKDVDGFHPVNLGRMMTGLPAFLPATPYGIMTLLERSDVDISGRHVVVVGRSNIVGTPLSVLMSRKKKPGNATVTLCHSFTANMKELTRQADVLVAALGKPEFIKADMVKKDAVVIDVGIHRLEDDSQEKGYRMVGDVDFKEVSKVASKITPVPGGVGPMTIVSLLLNTLKSFKKEIYP